MLRRSVKHYWIYLFIYRKGLLKLKLMNFTQHPHVPTMTVTSCFNRLISKTTPPPAPGWKRTAYFSSHIYSLGWNIGHKRHSSLGVSSGGETPSAIHGLQTSWPRGLGCVDDLEAGLTSRNPYFSIRQRYRTCALIHVSTPDFLFSALNQNVKMGPFDHGPVIEQFK